MTTVVTVVVIAAMASLAVGLLAPLAATLRRRHGPQVPALLVDMRPVYRSFSRWTVAIGVFQIASPAYFYGPSWSYFGLLPHNGSGMGVCLAFLGSLQILALWTRASDRTLSVVFFLIGFVYWMAGFILGAEGLLGHQGLMEAPFMLGFGVHAFAHRAALAEHDRQSRK